MLIDCAPGAPSANENAMKEALCAAKVLLPADSFGRLMEQVNAGRERPIAAGEIGEPSAEHGANAPEAEGPVRNMA